MEQDFHTFFNQERFSNQSHNLRNTSNLNRCSECIMNAYNDILRKLGYEKMNKVDELKKSIIEGFYKFQSNELIRECVTLSNYINKHFVNNSNCSTQVPLPPSTPMNCFNHCFYHVQNIFHMNAGKLIKSHSQIMNLMKKLKSIENPQEAHGNEQERSKQRSRCFGELQFWGKFEKNQSSVIKDFKF